MAGSTRTVRVTATEAAWRQGKLDDYARALVMIQPLPFKLFENIRRVDEGRDFTRSRPARRSRGSYPWERQLLVRYSVRRAHPDEMDARMHRVLSRLCAGDSLPDIAKAEHYSEHTIKEISKLLLILFDAKNRGHLCALAVAGGYVKM